ncbi:hypothetical protein KIN20_026408 [Parelaphostrongylus tenuis]|uniref:PID domain-containing protein n=1 Tax=Parelaphostrongylus tenuis TaxID=148309 RepID=A0AAD5QXZ9_PARTN|nr:hypothetical protein KIN20_026408 [Parelaphostrongylus tenuis]
MRCSVEGAVSKQVTVTQRFEARLPDEVQCGCAQVLHRNNQRIAEVHLLKMLALAAVFVSNADAMLRLPSSASHFFTLPFRKKSQRCVVDPPNDSYSVIYLGNVLTVLASGEHCFDKPLALIWKAYCSRTGAGLNMNLNITRSGLKAETKEQGLTKYWHSVSLLLLLLQNIRKYLLDLQTRRQTA